MTKSRENREFSGKIATIPSSSWNIDPTGVDGPIRSRGVAGDRYSSQIIALTAFAIALAAAGCHRGGVTTISSCPPGDTLMGAAPPKGEEQWCQKIVDGKPVKDGPFALYGIGGTRMIAGSYSNGRQTGEWTMWYENGQRASVDHYKNGEQDGLHTSWYANGQKAIEGYFRQGRRVGVWTRWDPSGLRSEKLTYGDSTGGG